MSANLLTLNSSETEFLIIGLKQQLSKIDNSSLNTTHSARNLGFTLMNILPSLIRSQHIRHARYLHVIRIIQKTVKQHYNHRQTDRDNTAGERASDSLFECWFQIAEWAHPYGLNVRPTHNSSIHCLFNSHPILSNILTAVSTNWQDAISQQQQWKDKTMKFTIVNVNNWLNQSTKAIKDLVEIWRDLIAVLLNLLLYDCCTFDTDTQTHTERQTNRQTDSDSDSDVPSRVLVWGCPDPLSSPSCSSCLLLPSHHASRLHSATWLPTRHQQRHQWRHRQQITWLSDWQLAFPAHRPTGHATQQCHSLGYGKTIKYILSTIIRHCRHVYVTWQATAAQIWSFAYVLFLSSTTKTPRRPTSQGCYVNR